MRRVLIVDDEKDFFFLIQQRFKPQIQSKELFFFFARDGHEALKILAHYHPIHAVITDIHMPGMDGLTLLEKIRGHGCHVCSIIMSAYDDTTNLRKAMNWGAFDFLTKPIKFHEFEKTLIKALDKNIDCSRSSCSWMNPTLGPSPGNSFVPTPDFSLLPFQIHPLNTAPQWNVFYDVFPAANGFAFLSGVFPINHPPPLTLWSQISLTIRIIAFLQHSPPEWFETLKAYQNIDPQVRSDTMSLAIIWVSPNGVEFQGFCTGRGSFFLYPQEVEPVSLPSHYTLKAQDSILCAFHDTETKTPLWTLEPLIHSP